MRPLGDILLCCMAVLAAAMSLPPHPCAPIPEPAPAAPLVTVINAPGEPVAALEEVAATPTLREYELVYLKPLTQGEKLTVTTDFGTSLAALVSTDISAGEKDAEYVQLLRITNRSGNTLCYGDEAWSGSDSCATICSGSSMTCDGSSTDGAPVPTGESVTDAFDGTSCICARADAATTTATVERTVRDAIP